MHPKAASPSPTTNHRFHRARECAGCGGIFQLLGRPTDDGVRGAAMVVFCPYCKAAELADPVLGARAVERSDVVPAAWPRLVSAVRASGGRTIEIPFASAPIGQRGSTSCWVLKTVSFHCHPDAPVRLDVERCGHGVACPLCGRVEPLRRRAA